MLKACKKKLKSTAGASLAVALLFFVFMAVVGSVILAAASAGMGRIKNADQGNQERYALYSAANVVVGAFAGRDAFNFNDNEIRESGNANSGYTYIIPESAWPYLEDQNYTYTDASNLEEIRHQIAEKVFRKSWGAIEDELPENESSDSNDDVEESESSDSNENATEGDLSEPNEDTEFYWSSLDNADGTTVFKFQLSGEDDWSKNASAYKDVNVKLTVQDNLDLVGEFSFPNPDIKEKYYIRIPFSSDAQIKYDYDGSSKTITLDHFQWEDKNQVEMSTKELRLTGDDDQ